MQDVFTDFNSSVYCNCRPREGRSRNSVAEVVSQELRHRNCAGHPGRIKNRWGHMKVKIEIEEGLEEE